MCLKASLEFVTFFIKARQKECAFGNIPLNSPRGPFVFDF